MRDLLLMSIIVGGSLAALRRPWIGVILWTWVSVMNPHEQFAWRAANWPVAMIVAVCTLLGLLFTRDRQNPLLGAPAWALLGFTIWTCVTLPFSIHFDESLPLWDRSMKIFLMVFVTMALLDSREKIDRFIWIIVFSLGFYGVKGGVFTILKGGEFLVWGPGGFIGGNNEIALALVMTIPLMRYLQMQSPRRWIRYALGGSMLLTAITVLGTYSRGALLAVGVMTLFLWWKTKRKVGSGIVLLVVAATVLTFMPDKWWGRMETIGGYQQDTSAMGRINAWWMAWHLAQDRFFGGGFMISTGEVFRVYAPVPDDVHAAHSIYFQVMGEHGFVGLFLFLAIGILTWLAAQRLIGQCAATPATKWAADLAAMVQVGMVGYAVGGAFLSLAYFDLPYDMMAAVMVAASVVRKSVALDATHVGRATGIAAPERRNTLT